jgi:hypothetical protein
VAWPLVTRANLARAIRYTVPALVAVYVLLLVFPEVAFAEHATYKNFRVYSSRPINRNIYRILDRVQTRLAASGIDDPHAVHRIFLCESPGRYRFFAPRAVGSFGVSYGLLGETFLAPADVAADTITRAASWHNTRSLSSVIAHELTHLLLARRFGVVRDFFTPSWKKEGFCEYVAGEPTLGWEEGLRLIREGQDARTGPLSYVVNYATMKYLIDVIGDGAERIFAEDYAVKDPRAVWAEVLAAARP